MIRRGRISVSTTGRAPVGPGTDVAPAYASSRARTETQLVQVNLSDWASVGSSYKRCCYICSLKPSLARQGLSCRCCYRGEVGSEDAGHGYLQCILPVSAFVLCRKTYVPEPTCTRALLARGTATYFVESVLLLKVRGGYCALERSGRLSRAA